MEPKKAYSIAKHKLSIISLTLMIDTIYKAVWRRREPGVKGLLLPLLSIGKYIGGMFICYSLLTWRAKIIFSIYTWFRRIDDIMDKIATPPVGYDRESYVTQKNILINSLSNINNLKTYLLKEDLLIINLLKEAQFRKIDIVEEITNLWTVMLWDNKRINQGPVSKEELSYYASLQDNAILDVCIKTFNGDIHLFRESSKLIAGTFSKVDWLADINEDLKRGTINIPEESLKKYDIQLTELLNCESWDDLKKVSGFLDWYKEEFELIAKEWTKTKKIFNKNLKKLFSSNISLFIFRKLIINEFQTLFKKLAYQVYA